MIKTRDNELVMHSDHIACHVPNYEGPDVHL